MTSTAADPLPGLDPDLAALADVRSKVRAARAAFNQLEGADQADLDHLVRAMATAGTAAAEELARLAADETGYGVYEHKVAKNLYNTGFVAEWMLERRAVGVLWVDEVNRVTAIGCPMGVIAGIIPVTNPTSTVLFKSLAAVKSGNAIVHAPHPRAAHFVTEVTGPLVDYDHVHDGSLVLTLRAFFDANCSQKLAAERLFIHHKTMRYRLERIRQLTGLDLSQHEDRMRADFALRLLQVHDAEGPGGSTP